METNYLLELLKHVGARCLDTGKDASDVANFLPTTACPEFPIITFFLKNVY